METHFLQVLLNKIFLRFYAFYNFVFFNIFRISFFTVYLIVVKIFTADKEQILQNDSLSNETFKNKTGL